MKQGRFSEEQIIDVLKQHEAGRKVRELSRVCERSDYLHLEVEVWRYVSQRGATTEGPGRSKPPTEAAGRRSEPG